MAANTGFIDPTAGSASVAVSLAVRPGDLKGKVVGVLDNTKEQAEVILQTLGEALRDKYGASEVIMRRKR